jgi:hypothetical protein
MRKNAEQLVKMYGSQGIDRVKSVMANHAEIEVEVAMVGDEDTEDEAADIYQWLVKEFGKGADPAVRTRDGMIHLIAGLRRISDTLQDEIADKAYN